MPRRPLVPATYAALLRGINVGGNNIIPMAALTRTFARLGFPTAKTLLASGNVAFQAPPTELRALERTIERGLAADFAYEAKVVVKSRAELDAIVANLPAGWRRPTAEHRYYVMFLRAAIDDAGLVAKLAPRSGVETLDYHPGVLFWRAKRAELSRSRVARLTSGPIYSEMTVRNIATTTKLAALMTSLAEANA